MDELRGEKKGRKKERVEGIEKNRRRELKRMEGWERKDRK